MLLKVGEDVILVGVLFVLFVVDHVSETFIQHKPLLLLLLLLF
jgi:hypothetical protein